MPDTVATILQVAIPSPLRRRFDYLPPDDFPGLPVIGARVRVPFGRRTLVGVVVGHGQASALPRERLKAVVEVLDGRALLDGDLLKLLQWASDYYHHPIGEVIQTALPVLLRQGGAAQVVTVDRWRLTQAGQALDPETLTRAPRQQALLRQLAACAAGLTAGELNARQSHWRPALAKLMEHGWVERFDAYAAPLREPLAAAPELHPEQQQAVAAVTEAEPGFNAYLLHGVTGSGKTEVYLRLIQWALAQGRQALLLVPEIGLTPQLIERLRQRIPAPLTLVHSGLTDRERLDAWVRARSGEAQVVVGTRSAIFTPLAKPGLILVDEEHDGSFKQQEGFRYSARDLAVKRARELGVAVVLGSATPSLESLANVAQGRYQLLRLNQRAGGARPPQVQLHDVRHRPLSEGLSAELIERARAHLEAGGQVMLFLNRRGFAPTLICHECGWVADCQRCDAHLTWHRGRGVLSCHHCGSERRVPPQCPDCGTVDMRPRGVGTERLEQALVAAFPSTPVIRIDRDSTRRKGSLDRQLEQVRTGEPCLLVGTQMLAKGHDFPHLTLVGLLEVDQALFSADFRAPERLAQLLVQVAGRAGRGERLGEVWVQTYHPDHPLLNLLVREGYAAFAEQALTERHQAQLPPVTAAALLRAEAHDPREPQALLRQVVELSTELEAFSGVELLGPVPALMERRAGRYRMQLLLLSAERGRLHAALRRLLPQIEALPLTRRVRWSLDVDPQDLF